ncbi:ACT domain-containing protein [Pararhizobium sp. A13]|uniref:ACT domain-containing protein n=1 Tax=Pararhizobium sp. A13 TaxID=3133975 RepID=UPI003249A3A2
MTHKLLIRLVDAEYAITRLNIGTPLPEWLMGPGFWTVSSSREEMTLVCRATRIPSNVQSSGGWRCLRIEQHFTFEVPGVLASVLNPLSDAGVGIFANSTFSTDYVFIIGSDLDKAVAALKAHGHEIMS